MKATLIKSHRDRKRAKIRSLISGTAERPRLSVFKSNTSLYAQLINDEKGTTLAEAHGKSPEEVGKAIAVAGKAKSVETVVFDRGGYLYTGKVKALADAAREAGLKF